jgi:hypothetical protein
LLRVLGMKTKVLVKSRIQAGRPGGWDANHSATKITVKSGVKAGAVWSNHNPTKLKLKTGLKAGALTLNHSASKRR